MATSLNDASGTESDQSCSNTFSVTTYPSVLLCVAQENLTTAHQFGQWKSCAQALTFSNLWLGMWMMIAKAHMRGLWEACRCCCCILFTRYVSPSFHIGSPSYLFTQLGISRRSMCIGACYAGTASWCDLRDPGWGDPGFRHCDFFAWHLPVIFNICGFELLLQGWPAQDGAHKLPGHYVSSLLLDMSFHYVMFWFLWCFCAFLCCFFVVLLLACVGLVSVFFFSRRGMVSYWLAPRTRKPVTALASLAVINTASKHLHNDLARAIKALEQKKRRICALWPNLCHNILLVFGLDILWHLAMSLLDVSLDCDVLISSTSYSGFD